ncbi:MAG: T9SS type A sorting domain-containing protein, partial [Chitinophagales bacterium]
GIAITDFNGENDIAYSLGLQSDGKIVAGGYVYGTNGDFGLARYLNDIEVNTDDITPNNLSISIFPNPTDGIVHIQSNEISLAETTINVYSMTGEKLLQQKFGAIGNQPEQIDLSGFYSGMYFITCSTQDAIFRQKIQVIK